MPLENQLSTMQDDIDNLKTQFGASGSTFYSFNVLVETVEPRNLYTVIGKRTLGSSFIIGHPVWGIIGSGSPYIVTGSQPYIGDSRGGLIFSSVNSPDNTFFEFFDGSRFRNPVFTSADWNTGSHALYFSVAGFRAATELIYLGSDVMKAVKISITGSDINNVTGEVSMIGDQGQAHEVPLGSWSVPATPGSAILVRFIRNTGTTPRIDSIKVEYSPGSEGTFGDIARQPLY